MHSECLNIKILTECVENAKSNSKQIDELKERIEKHDEKLEKLQEHNVALARLTIILDEMRNDNKAQAIINEKITETLSEIKTTMVNTNTKIETLASSQEQINHKLTQVEERIEKVDGRTHIDVFAYLKDNFLPFLFKLAGWGGLAFLIYEISKYSSKI